MDEVLITVIFIFILTLLSIGLITSLKPDREVEAINRGYGEYCTDRGQFAWIGECPEGGK